MLRFFSYSRFWTYLTPGLIAAPLFIGDLLIPRGATPAIGYCAIPVLAAAARRRDFLIGMTIGCTILTWLGYLFEPPGAAAWTSVFDRAMITGALWLIYELVHRRNVALAALAKQTRELEATQRELERSNAELDGFASMVAHDIRGPLGSIGLFSQLLGQGANSTNDIAEWALSIRREITSLSDLIQRLLSYGRVGGGEVHLMNCDCDSVLNSVRQKLKSLITDSGARVTNDPLPTLPADAILMAELFQNLIENGIKYHSQDPPRIHLSAERCPEGWRFLVRDNGIGIASKDLERIFRPFRQGRPSDARHGVGLGLATCKRIVERHGGAIKAQSTAGRGSTFTFMIPMRTDAEVTKPAATAPNASAREVEQTVE